MNDATLSKADLARWLSRTDALFGMLKAGADKLSPEVTQALATLQKEREAWPECDIGVMTFLAKSQKDPGVRSHIPPWKAPVSLEVSPPSDKPFLVHRVEAFTSQPARVEVYAPGNAKWFAESGNVAEGCWCVIQPRERLIVRVVSDHPHCAVQGELSVRGYFLSGSE